MRLRTLAPLRRIRAISFGVAALASLTLLPTFRAVAAVPGFTPPTGFQADSIGITADTFAVGPGGLFATGTGSASAANVTLYNHADPAGRRVLATYTIPDLHFLGGMAFDGSQSLLVSENGTQDTVYSLNLATGQAGPLAPKGSIRNASEVRVRPTDGAIFVVASNPPGKGVVYQIENGAAVPFLSSIGTGYLGGLAFDRFGDVFVADTNDPNFAGNAGRILVAGPAGAPEGALDLAGGGGSGVYDITIDANGALYATTGRTVTRDWNGLVSPFGSFSGDYPFPTDIAVDPSGGILVNGGFTAAGAIFRIHTSRGSRLRDPLPALVSGFTPSGRGR